MHPRSASLTVIPDGRRVRERAMTRPGVSDTGVVASDRDIGTARTHAEAQGLVIDYRASTAEDLLAAGEPAFDVILNMEVIEHVADPARYLQDCAQLLKPGGLM